MKIGNGLAIILSFLMMQNSLLHAAMIIDVSESDGDVIASADGSIDTFDKTRFEPGKNLTIKNMCSDDHAVSTQKTAKKGLKFDSVDFTMGADDYPDWKQLNSNPLLNRGGASMVYFGARESIVIFGGWVDGPVAETWEYHEECNYWSQVKTANSPSARVWHSLVYDSVRQRVILFGGINPSTNIHFNDTWEYDGTDWQQITTSTSPPEMSVRTMVFDSGRNRTVLVGGESPSASYNDTWEYDGSDWNLVNTPVSPPAPGALAAMAYDETRGRSVLSFHDGTAQLQTWEYDGSTWVGINTTVSPLGRWAHTMAYDTVSQHVMLFGGTSPYSSSDFPMNDSWEYDGSTWTEILSPTTPPPADQHAMAFDAMNKQIIVLNWGETWAYSYHAIADDCPFIEFKVHPRNVYLRDGKTTEQLRIEVRDSESRPVNPDSFEFEFTSSEPGLVQVSPGGLVTSTGYGRAQVLVTMVESGLSSKVDILAGHLRTQPVLQYLSLNGQSTGRVLVDMGNADGTPVDLDGHTVEFICEGCAPGQPLQLSADGEVTAVELIDSDDPDRLTVLAVVDGVWAQNWANIYVSSNDLGLTVNHYVLQNISLTSADNASGYDFDSIIRTNRIPEMLELAFLAQQELTGGVWGGGGRQELINYVAPDSANPNLPPCGASGNPILIGTFFDDPSRTCFEFNAELGSLHHGFGLLFHELGHNFTWTHGGFADFADAGDSFAYSEGLATAASMFSCEAILRSGTELGLSPKIRNSLEESWLCWRNRMAGSWLTDYIDAGADYADFDPDIVDEIFWTLAQEYGYGIFYRFYSSLLPREVIALPFPMKTTTQQATFFALAMSEAIGVDLKARFRDDWGFPIDDAAWELMRPYVSLAVAQRDPSSNAGEDRVIGVAETVSLDDGYVFDWEGDELKTLWEIVQKPVGSNPLLGDKNTLNTTFWTDVPGTYVLVLTANDDWVTGARDTVRLEVIDTGTIFSNGFE